MKQEHLQLIDDILRAHALRVQEMARDLQPVGRSTADVRVDHWSVDELRASRLGQDLVDLAHFAEGVWSQPHTISIEPIVGRIYQALFGNSLATEVHLPRHFHKTPLGILIAEAYALLYQEEEVLAPDRAWRELGVARQTIYDWVEEGKLTPVYLTGQMMLLRREVDAVKEQRRARLAAAP